MAENDKTTIKIPNFNNEDETIVDCLVDNIMTDLTEELPSAEGDQNVIKSRTFVSKPELAHSQVINNYNDNTLSTTYSDSANSSPRMDAGLRIRPESPTGSYESTSFESLHSDELAESCPLIFNVDDVGSPRTDLPEDPSAVYTTQHSIRKARSDSFNPNFANDNVNEDGSLHIRHKPSSSPSGDMFKAKGACESPTTPICMTADKSFVYKTNLNFSPTHEDDESNDVPVYQFISSTKENVAEECPEYYINQLDDDLIGLTTKLDAILAEDNQQLNLNLTPEEKQNMEKLSNTVKHSWQKHKKNMFDFLGDFDRLEYHFHDAVTKLQVQCGVNLKLKHERREFQAYLEEREEECMTKETSLKSELEFLRLRLLDICKKNVDSSNVWRMLESLMNLQFDREQAIILDTLKQNKLNEMKLLIFRQQLLIEELQEDNQTLQQEIEIDEDTPQQQLVTKDSSDGSNNNMTASICDVLYCDRHRYLPGHSTHPELASLQVFNIGGRHSGLKSACEEIFNPDSVFPPDNSEEDLDANELYQTLLQNGPASPNFTLDDN